ncbi:MAG: serine/threonine-protein kinase [Acidobacteriota bacterium]
MDPSKDPRRSAERDEERYLLGKELGRGGIGRVVLAVDRKLLGREVAMKLLAPARRTGRTLRLASGKTPPERVRFFEEARITAQLSHPNIVPVHDLGTRPSGEAFYTMGVVRGRTLSAEIHAVHRRLADGTLPRDDWSVERTRLVQALQGTCHAIAYAHSRGIVHRDIKPANVMLGDFGETIVLDWGLAKVIGPRGARVPRKRAPRRPRREIGDGPATFETVAFDDGEWTVEGTVIGTPSYMSPEQAHGRIAEIDELSDVFSLGAVLFELLAGRPPFVGLSLLETLIAARKCDVPDVRALAGAPVPEDLAQICERALAPRKSERFPGVDAMVREITLAMDGARERRRMRERCRDALGRARVLVASYHEAIEDAARARAAQRRSRGRRPVRSPRGREQVDAPRGDQGDGGRHGPDADASFNAALVALAEALVFDPRDPEARREMGEFHYVHMTRAEREQRWKDRDFHQGRSPSTTTGCSTRASRATAPSRSRRGRPAPRWRSIVTKSGAGSSSLPSCGRSARPRSPGSRSRWEATCFSSTARVSGRRGFRSSWAASRRWCSRCRSTRTSRSAIRWCTSRRAPS